MNKHATRAAFAMLAVLALAGWWRCSVMGARLQERRSADIEKVMVADAWRKVADNERHRAEHAEAILVSRGRLPEVMP